MDDLVQFAIDDRGIATITLNRPESLNAINMAMRDSLWTYLEACRDIPDVRALVFRGEGRAFSAGADISEFGSAPGLIQARLARHQRDVWGLLLSLPFPTIAAMHGFCFGAGLELPLCCDVRIAAEGTTFGLPEVTLGYIPSAGGTQTLPRRIPPGAAADMILSGQPVDTTTAARWKLVSEVVPSAALDDAIEARIQSILQAAADDVMAKRRRMVAS